MTSKPANARGPHSTASHRPPFWAKLPVTAGNLIQLGGIILGLLLVVLAADIKSTAAASTALAVLGIVLTAFSSHAIGHWLIGRIVGLRFAFIGVRGTEQGIQIKAVVHRVWSEPCSSHTAGDAEDPPR